MSLRNLFSNGVVSSIPAVSTATAGQALTVNLDGKLAWITPGAGPTGPIQGVAGTAGQIVASEPSEAGIVTLSLPPIILANALTLAHDPATVNSGYVLPASTTDTDGDVLANDNVYVMQFAEATAENPGYMTFAKAEAGAGVTSIKGEDGILPSTAASGPVTLSLGDINPDSVETADITATTSLVIGTAPNIYKMPIVTTPLTDGTNYVLQCGTGNQLSFTAAGAGTGTMTGITQGNGIAVSGNPNVDPTISLAATVSGLTAITSAAVTASTSLTVGTSTGAYTLPANATGLTIGTDYVLQYAADQKFTFTEAPAGGPGVQSIRSDNDGSVGSGIVVDDSDEENPFLELGNIVPETINVKGEYTLPTTMTGAVAGYTMILPTPLPTAGTSAAMIWGPVGGGTGGTGTVTSINAGANIEVTGANPTVNPTVALNPVLTGITSIGTGTVTATGEIQAATFNATNTITATGAIQAAAFNTAQPGTENAAMLNLGNNFIVKAGTTSAAGTSLLFQDRDTNKGFRIGSAFNGMQIITGEEAGTPPVTQGYILPTSLPTATGQVLSVSALQAGSTLATTQWVAQTGGGAVASVTSTNTSFIQQNGTTGAVELSLPDEFDISVPGPAGTQQFALGGCIIQQDVTETPTVSNTTTFEVLNNYRGLNIASDGSVEVCVGQTGTPLVQNEYVLPITMPTDGQFLQAGTVTNGKVNCTWASGTASGINSVVGTAGQIVETSETPGLAKLGLSPQVAITDLATGRPSLTVGNCIISAEITGTTPDVVTVTNLTITDPPTGNGFIVSNLGTKIQVGDGNTPPTTTSTYFLPKNAPAVGDIMTCTTAAVGSTPAICAWSSSPSGDTVSTTVTMTGIVLQTPPNTPKATSISPTIANTNKFDIRIFQAGAAKYLYMDFDVLYNNDGCQCIFEENTYIIGEIDCGNIDITDAPGVQSEILTDNTDMNIGLISYSTTTRTGSGPFVTTPAGSYGYASVVLKRLDINTLTLRLVLLPRETITITGTTPNQDVVVSTTSAYGIANGQWLTFSAVQSFSSFGNQTPSAKCLFSYY